MRKVNLDGPLASVTTLEADTKEWPVAPPSPAELPSGTYVAGYRGSRRGGWFRQHKVELFFEIAEPVAQQGCRVSLFATLPERGRISQRSKYYRLWVHANGGPPLRGGRMSPKVFRGYWRVRVGWSTPRNDEPGLPTVTELLERIAGGPTR